MQSQSQTEGQYQAVWQTHQVNWRRKFLDPVGVVAALESNVWVYVLELQQLENEDHYRIFRFSALCLQSPACGLRNTVSLPCMN